MFKKNPDPNFHRKNNRPNYCEERLAERDLLILDLNDCPVAIGFPHGNFMSHMIRVL